MKRYFLLLTLASLAITDCVFAQETSLGEMLNLESKVTITKMKDELAKSNLAEAKALPTPKLDLPPRRVIPDPKTIAVYGVNPNYEAMMDFDGNVVNVKRGSVVFGKLVTDISVQGVTLQAPGKPKRAAKAKHSKKRKSGGTTNTQHFYPLLVR